ncbi:hypothetical protein VaNZ11_012641, partial [Volvox africanus]
MVLNGITQIIHGLDDELYATEKVVTYVQLKDFNELKERLLGIEVERLVKRKVQPEPATALYAGRDGGHKFRGCFTYGGDHLSRYCPKKGSRLRPQVQVARPQNALRWIRSRGGWSLAPSTTSQVTALSCITTSHYSQ